MKAVRIHRYGGPEELVLDEVPAPRPGPGDVLIDVHASSVNPIDAKVRAGLQRAVIPLRLPATLGMDVSGVVLEAGRDVRGLAPGDEVFSSPSHRRMGCYAERVVVRAAEVARKPRNLSHLEAASLPLVGLTAWDALVGALRLGPGQRVLVQAGAGGVGTAAIQLARHLGAEVLATCSAGNAALVEGLGARAIDYRAVRFEEAAAGVDAILESMGGGDIDRALRTVRPGGRVALISSGLPELAKRHGPYLGLLVMVGGLLRRALGAKLGRGVAVRMVTRSPRGDRLAGLAALAEAGALRPVIDHVVPLAELPRAHRELETGRTRGKIVLAVKPT